MDQWLWRSLCTITVERIFIWPRSCQEVTKQDFKRYTVNARSLDSLFQSLARPVSFVKCDVEGHELTVFNGARRFFETQKPALLMEIAGRLEEEGSPAMNYSGS